MVKSAVTKEEMVHLYWDTLQVTFKVNPNVNQNYSEATIDTIRNFLNQSPTSPVRKTNDWLTDLIT
jgi:hypothetical protein